MLEHALGMLWACQRLRTCGEFSLGSIVQYMNLVGPIMPGRDLGSSRAEQVLDFRTRLLVGKVVLGQEKLQIFFYVIPHKFDQVGHVLYGWLTTQSIDAPCGMIRMN
jgi:hypothetical protein